MEKVRFVINRLLHPPVLVLLLLPTVVYAALIAVFLTENTASLMAYIIYALSAYGLVILLAVLPKIAGQMKAALKRSKMVQKLTSHELLGRYVRDLSFRSSVSIYQGMTVNFFYVIFRIITGFRYASVWFISMAVYYLVLGCLRLYLINGYRHRSPVLERHCYRRTAGLLFLLNIPMGGMIVLMIRTNASVSYPGYVIYLSALYTFYAMILSVVNLQTVRRTGSAILSAARVLNVISAMMSVLCLQTAMISRFSARGEAYRRMMNTITGCVVYGIVILIAVAMLWRSRKTPKGGGAA